MLADDLVHPLDVGRDASVEAGVARLCASTTPAHSAVQHPTTILETDQRSTRVALHQHPQQTRYCTRIQSQCTSSADFSLLP